MIKHKNLFFILLVLAGGCIEKDLVPGSGEVRLDYDWTELAAGGTEPPGMVAYVYPADRKGEIASFEGDNLKGALHLPRGSYRVLTFNRDAERVDYTDLADFDRARASLKPLGTKAGGQTLLPVADWLYGGTVADLQVDGKGIVRSTVRMNPYVRRIHIEVKTDVSKVGSVSGTLTNTAIGVSLKDGKPAPVGNGTTQFDLTRTDNAFVADFVIFGVDSSSWETGKELRNIMNIVVMDHQNTSNELEIDISGEISGGTGSEGRVEEEMAGIGIVRVTVDGWEPDDEDHSMTETPIRLAAYVGVPVKSADQAFVGDYGVSVEKTGSVPGAVYVNNKVSVDGSGNSLVAEEMYYPLGLMNLYAYAPYSAEIPSAWTLTGNRTTDDLLWAKITNLTETKSEVPLRFGHLMSAIRVEVVRGTNIPEAGFEGVQVRVCNTVTTARLDLKAGTAVADGPEVTELTPEASEVVVDNGMAVESCIVPQTVGAGKVLVHIKVAGDLIFTYKPAEPMVFGPGKRKVIRLTLNDEEVSPLTKTGAGVRLEAQVREENF